MLQCPVAQLILPFYEAQDGGVISIFDGESVVLGRDNIIGVQGEEFRAETAALWTSCSDRELSRHTRSHSHYLWSFCQEVHNPNTVGVRMPRSASLCISLPGQMVLKAEL